MNPKEIAAFVDAYSRIFGYVSKEDALAIANMLSQGLDEDDVYEKYSEATSVLDAYILWGVARKLAEGKESIMGDIDIPNAELGDLNLPTL